MTRTLMSASAVFLALLGLTATFAPDELAGWLGATPSPVLLLMVQLLGAVCLGFAVLNWMARDNLIGGIYSRPLATGNLMHFLVGGLAALRLIAASAELHRLWPLALIYVAFAAAFGLVLFRHPIRAAEPASRSVRTG